MTNLKHLFSNSYDKRHLPFGNISYIGDPSVVKFLGDLKIDLNQACNNTAISKKFTEYYLNWITSSKNNTVLGLDSYPFWCVSNGTTECFDFFYAKNKNRRFRCFKGEYLYHKLSWRNNYESWAFLEEDEIRPNDAVVISIPFSDTGAKHEHMDQIILECNKMEVPVLIDCAYFSIASDLSYNFNSECISDVTFSLSKTFPVAHSRIGIRLTRVDNDDPLFVRNKHDYVNRISCYLGYQLMKNFSPDYIFNTYREKQLLMCAYLGVKESNTVSIATGNGKWIEYNRGGPTNRLSFHKWLSRSMQDFYDENQIDKF